MDDQKARDQVVEAALRVADLCQRLKAAHSDFDRLSELDGDTAEAKALRNGLEREMASIKALSVAAASSLGPATNPLSLILAALSEDLDRLRLMDPNSAEAKALNERISQELEAIGDPNSTMKASTH